VNASNLNPDNSSEYDLDCDENTIKSNTLDDFYATAEEAKILINQQSNSIHGFSSMCQCNVKSLANPTNFTKFQGPITALHFTLHGQGV